VSFFMLCLLLAVAAALSSCASAPDSVVEALKARYHGSIIEINDPRTQGRIVSPGAVLILQPAGLSAKKFRVQTKGDVAIVQDRIETVLALVTAN